MKMLEKLFTDVFSIGRRRRPQYLPRIRPLHLHGGSEGSTGSTTATPLSTGRISYVQPLRHSSMYMLTAGSTEWEGRSEVVMPNGSQPKRRPTEEIRTSMYTLTAGLTDPWTMQMCKVFK